MRDASRHSYAAPGGLINVEALRAEAVKRATSSGTATTIHHHRHDESCKGKHEYVTSIDGGVDIKERQL